MLRLST
jgi:thiopurine S-methyltransferase